MRLVIALFVVGLCAPIVGSAGTADAQVWKVKKGKPGAKPAAGKPAKSRPTRTARPTMKKKGRPAATRPRVKLVPDEDESATERDADDRTDDRDRDDDDDGPIVIHVEEID